MANRCALVYLLDELQSAGVLQRAAAYVIDAELRSMTITYYNRTLQKTRLYICRTSRLCYYIFHEGEKTTKRNYALAADYVIRYLTDAFNWSAFRSSLSDSDLNRFLRLTETQQNTLFKNWLNGP